jgi:putative ABC transport system ATP-binding protein
VIEISHFQLEPSEQAVLSGESGSGKTTFLHLIAGILTPDRGRIDLDGQRVTDLGEAARDRLRSETVGYVFQTFNLLQGHTVLENVLLAMRFGRGADPDFAHAMLDRVGLSHRAHHFPHQLSSGQQQRVSVARALANHPKLVLADEPTGNLDPRNGHEVLKLLRETCRENGASLLLVSHDPAALSDFDTVREFNAINRLESSPVRS